MSVVLVVCKYLAFGMLGTVIFLLFLYGMNKLLDMANPKIQIFVIFMLLSIMFGLILYAAEQENEQKTIESEVQEE